MKRLYTTKLDNTGLGDKLVHLHQIVSNSTVDDIIVDANYDSETLYLKSQLSQQRHFIHSTDTFKSNMSNDVYTDLQLFEAGSDDYDVFVEWPKLHKYDFFNKVANMKKR